jgi:hypothetical protein
LREARIAAHGMMPGRLKSIQLEADPTTGLIFAESHCLFERLPSLLNPMLFSMMSVIAVKT